MITIDTSFGPCEVHLDGPDDGPAVLLVHGVLVHSSVWDRIVPGLADGHRVVRPDLPIGAHRLPARCRDLLTPDGIADALVELLDHLGIDRAVVVGSDTGGALTQVLAARHPERVAGVVLLSSDTLDHFPPTVLKPILPLLAVPRFVDLMGRVYRSKRLRRSWIGAGLLLNHPIEGSVIDPWFDEVAANRASRHDMAAFLRHCRPAVTNAAVEVLERTAPPLLLAWSRGDRLFPESDAQELHRRIAGSRLAFVDGARTFAQVDRPDAVLDLVLPFLAEVADRSEAAGATW